MIPKRIFYIWGYGENKSQIANICIENWRLMLPDYEIIEVNEKTPEWFDFDYEYEHNLWFKTVYDLKMWAYVSDYIRVKTLYDHGGIYFDTDVTVYKNFDIFLSEKMFLGNQKSNIPELAIFGAEKNHPVLKDLYEFYQDEIWHSPNYIIINIFRELTEKNNYQNLYKIYPYDYFHPKYFYDEFSLDMITENTAAVHWGNGSWNTKKNRYFLVNKHRIPLKTLLKQLDFIEKNDKNANNKTKPNSLISVIMPVKNGENYMKDAISSVLKQNMNLEIVVVDDGSSDSTASIAREAGCKVLSHESSKGQVIAKNTGLKAAKGMYVIFCDHDDLLTENSLKTFYKEFEQDSELEVVIAKIKDFISPDAKNQEQKIKTDPYYGCLGGSIMLKKSVFDKIGLFDENISAGEIISLNSKFTEHNIKIKKIDFVSSLRRIHDTNYGKTNKNSEFKDYASILRAKLGRK